MAQHIDGDDTVRNNIGRASDRMLQQVIDAVEQTAVDVRNHAADNHDPGFAHAVGRYENDTVQLTNSIFPRLVRADQQAVEAEVSTDKTYAWHVELGTSRAKPYPFLLPALEANANQFRARLRHIRGNF